MDGRLTRAACGHPGRVVIGTYVECLKKFCDGLPGKLRCKHCGSDKIESFEGVNVPSGAKRCLDCGRLKWDWAAHEEDDGA